MPLNEQPVLMIPVVNPYKKANLNIVSDIEMYNGLKLGPGQGTILPIFKADLEDETLGVVSNYDIKVKEEIRPTGPTFFIWKVDPILNSDNLEKLPLKPYQK